MKTNHIIVLAISMLMAACNGEKLSSAQALDIVRSQTGYPKTFDHTIHTLSSESVNQLQNAGLDSKGYVTIIRETGATIGKPLVLFTDKSKPMLIETSMDDKNEGVQRVKVADTDLDKISSLKQSEDGKHARVEYTLIHKNVTPFSALVNRDFTKQDTRVIYLVKNGDKWETDKNQNWDL